MNSYSDVCQASVCCTIWTVAPSENPVKANAVNPAVGSACLNTYGRAAGLGLFVTIYRQVRHSFSQNSCVNCLSLIISDVWNIYLPYFYSFISFLGVLLLLCKYSSVLQVRRGNRDKS